MTTLTWPGGQAFKALNTECFGGKIGFVPDHSLARKSCKPLEK